jgi:hypothetical protein
MKSLSEKLRIEFYERNKDNLDELKQNAFFDYSVFIKYTEENTMD